MRIESVGAEVVDLGEGFVWGNRRGMSVVGVLVTLRADDGTEGHGLGWTAELPAAAVRHIIEAEAAPRLAGQSPFDRPRILEPLWRGFRVGTPLAAIGIVDVALWDLAGKAAGASVAQLLGQTRERVRACASAPPCDSAAECAPMVGEILEQGFTAVKLHVCGDVAADVAACREARRVAGPDVALMMDAMGIYGRGAALELGRALDELGFRWFEDPLRDDDLEGWVELGRAIRTPLAGVDSVRFTVKDYAAAIARGAYDIVRMDAARHGISQLRDLAVVADAFGLQCEGHAFGPALAQAANLQVALAGTNGEFCELPVPLGGLDRGVVSGLRLDAEGYVLAPPGPGLGLELDRSALKDSG